MSEKSDENTELGKYIKEEGMPSDIHELSQMLQAMKQQTDETAVTDAIEKALTDSGTTVNNVTTMINSMTELIEMVKDTGLDKLIDAKGATGIQANSDSPTRFAHLGFRFLYTLIAWFILGLGVQTGHGFFVSGLLFIIPIFMDYLKYNMEGRSWLRKTGIIISSIGTVFSILGLVGVLTIDSTHNVLKVLISNQFILLSGVSFNLSLAWLFFVAFVCLTAFDWWFHSVPLNQSVASGGEHND